MVTIAVERRNRKMVSSELASFFSCLVCFCFCFFRNDTLSIDVSYFLLFASFFRSDTIESVLCGSLFPSEFSINDMVKHWVEIFSGLDKVEVKALEKILGQKQRYACLILVITYIFPGVSNLQFSWCHFDGRLQEEMQKYLVLRQNCQVHTLEVRS